MITAETLRIGKTRGYREDVCIDGVVYWARYAMKKISEDSYETFYDLFDSRYAITPEDIDETEEIKFFGTFGEASAYLISKGADLDRFGPFKGNKPI